MAYSKFITLITGFTSDPRTRPAFPNRAACATDLEYSELANAYEAWGKVNYKSTRRAGVCKATTVLKAAEKLGITYNLKAEAASFDGSGKGRHAFRSIVL